MRFKIIMLIMLPILATYARELARSEADVRKYLDRRDEVRMYECTDTRTRSGSWNYIHEWNILEDEWLDSFCNQ